MKKVLLLITFSLVNLLIHSQAAGPDVPFTQRLASGGLTLKGNMTFISNSITNNDNPSPNVSYNGTGNNNDISLGYIDIDNNYGIAGSASTFSSSKSSLNLPSCSKVVWAGLYWAAMYPYISAADQRPPPQDFDKIKFKLPGQPYQDITGDIIYNNGRAARRPYACFKDITTDVQALPNPNGDYFAANIKATIGKCCGGTSAGWIMVVIYENETESSKYFSVFDGFSTIEFGQPPVTVPYSGFTTVPVGPNPATPAPVRADMIVATLEGDLGFTKDSFEIKDTSGNFVKQSNTLNPADNFFNSSITINDAVLAGRDPSSTNTLGFDADLFEIRNPNNSVIANDQTDLEVRFVTDQDSYWTFLNALAVEVIQPDIELVKTIDDGAGTDIAGSTVGLGADLWYNVSFQNTGTDDSINTIITDRLPKNVDLILSDLVLPTGVTLDNYDPPSLANGFRGELTFRVDDSLVEEAGAIYNIRLHVKVVSDCSELRDVCSNVIENQAFAKYKGLKGGIEVDNRPSVSGLDACDFGIAGTSNFLVDISSCRNFVQDVELCGPSVKLTAGSGFASYEWRDSAGNIIGTNQEITVTATGRYTVNKVNPPGTLAACLAFPETYNVIAASTRTNPILAVADNVLTCVSDGTTQLSEIYLCGSAASRTITTGIASPTTATWQVLSVPSTPAPDATCPDFLGTWVDVATNANSPTRDFSDEGQYRLIIEEPGGCFERFYFNVYKGTINPIIDLEHIVCTKDGSITVNNVPSGMNMH